MPKEEIISLRSLSRGRDKRRKAVQALTPFVLALIFL